MKLSVILRDEFDKEDTLVKLIDITKDNWIEVIFLTTNQKVTIQGNRDPYDAGNMPTLCENFVASNALSIVQSVYENGWITKAIEHEGKLIGFTMYGYCEENDFYELCRIMIDRKYQGNGYGTQAIKLVLEEMKAIEDCMEVYLSTDPENVVGKYVYAKIGFVSENRMIGDEELYKYVF